LVFPLFFLTVLSMIVSLCFWLKLAAGHQMILIWYCTMQIVCEPGEAAKKGESRLGGDAGEAREAAKKGFHAVGCREPAIESQC
jgi:hypothetical protein